MLERDAHLPFQVVFTGEQQEPDELDQQRAATVFSNLADQSILGHISLLSRRTQRTAAGDVFTYSRLGLGVRVDDHIYGVGIIAASNDEHGIQQISVTEVTNSTEGNSWTYVRVAGEPVRRTDLPDTEGRRRSQQVLKAVLKAGGINMAPGLGEELLNDRENAELERRLRLNDQPVGYEEIDGLVHFIEDAEPIDPTDCY